MNFPQNDEIKFVYKKKVYEEALYNTYKKCTVAMLVTSARILLVKANYKHICLLEKNTG